MDELSFLSSSSEFLIKVILFAAVQVLVYLILSKSSAVFGKTDEKTGGFAPSRSLSVRRVLAAVLNFSASGELQLPSPNPSYASSSACAEAISAALFASDFNEGFSF
ncbi:uncharacterized protein LOC110097264 [Dendrobium catenatum]|uniref:Uncharacterized protein n=1 Tax=Dendrobium catenatum TaxID=906689 RepID=A0A2I0XAZ9_9ASPA|nr:uncharacterized protein LOC110097264 [Dendrobium catenatum]PKU85054.1 hypothetical protein MA16_Dca022290 [Dendrobium catenatum]